MKFGKIFSKLSDHSFRRKFRLGRNPAFDWMFICLTAVIFFTTLGGIAIMRFYNLSALSATEISVSTGFVATNSTTTVNTQALESVISGFARQSNKFDALKNGAGTFTDPSR